jgi:hypothetical protein
MNFVLEVPLHTNFGVSVQQGNVAHSLAKYVTSYCLVRSHSGWLPTRRVASIFQHVSRSHSESNAFFYASTRPPTDKKKVNIPGSLTPTRTPITIPGRIIPASQCVPQELVIRPPRDRNGHRNQSSTSDSRAHSKRLDAKGSQLRHECY